MTSYTRLFLSSDAAGRTAFDEDGRRDVSLLAGLAAGHRRGVLAFVRRFQEPVFELAYAILDDSDLAAWVAEQTFVEVSLQACHFEPTRATVRAWILNMACALAIDVTRDQAPGFVATHNSDSSFGTQSERIKCDERLRVRLSIIRLPTEEAHALVLAGVCRLSASEIAELNDVPLATIRKRLSAGLSKLCDDLVGSLP
jgi:RNA polymerase sigma-70 factor (ECF subfamily)